jgi:hypothetical protein
MKLSKFEFLSVRKMIYKLMQRSKRANPPAEKSADNDRQNDRNACPKQGCIQFMRRNYCPYRRKRIKVQKNIYRPPAQPPEIVTNCRNNAQPYK